MTRALHVCPREKPSANPQSTNRSLSLGMHTSQMRRNNGLVRDFQR